MTPDTANRPQMSVEDFEELVRRAPRELRNRLELIGGRLCVRHGPLDVDEFEELAAVATETVRLEYINGSAKSSRPATFVATPNSAGSLVLRWAIDGKLKPGESGTITFRVRIK